MTLFRCRSSSHSHDQTWPAAGEWSAPNIEVVRFLVSVSSEDWAFACILRPTCFLRSSASPQPHLESVVTGLLQDPLSGLESCSDTILVADIFTAGWLSIWMLSAYLLGSWVSSAPDSLLRSLLISWSPLKFYLIPSVILPMAMLIANFRFSPAIFSAVNNHESLLFLGVWQKR